MAIVISPTTLLEIAPLVGPDALHWHSRLRKEDQAEADILANEVAMNLFEKTLHELTADEARQLIVLARFPFFEG